MTIFLALYIQRAGQHTHTKRKMEFKAWVETTVNPDFKQIKGLKTRVANKISKRGTLLGDLRVSDENLSLMLHLNKRMVDAVQLMGGRVEELNKCAKEGRVALDEIQYQPSLDLLKAEWDLAKHNCKSYIMHASLFFESFAVAAAAANHNKKAKPVVVRAAK